MIDDQQGRGDHDRSQARRDQVLCAAAECFRVNGFHGASMAELAKQSGMSVGHIYHYFENKEAIIEAIVERDLAVSMQRIEQLASAADAEEALLSGVHDNLAQCSTQQRMLLRLEVLAEAARSPRIAAKVRHADAIARERFLEVLGSYAAFSTMSRADLSARAEAIVAIIEGLSLRVLRNPDIDIERVMNEVRPALRVLMREGSPTASLSTVPA